MEILLLEHSTMGSRPKLALDQQGELAEVILHVLAGRFTQALQSPVVQALLGAHDQTEVIGPEGYFRSVSS